MGDVLLYPPIVFLIFIIIWYLVYRLGTAAGPKPSAQEGKLSTYACGEDIPGRKIRLGYHFFHIAFFFTILHVAALVIATVPSGGIAFVGIAYLVVALIAVVILLTD